MVKKSEKVSSNYYTKIALIALIGIVVFTTALAGSLTGFSLFTNKDNQLSGAQTANSPTWLHLANEGGSYTIPGGAIARVRFGAGTRWRELDRSGTVQCTNTFFGGDPAVGVYKTCQFYYLQPSVPTTSSCKVIPVFPTDYGSTPSTRCGQGYSCQAVFNNRLILGYNSLSACSAALPFPNPSVGNYVSVDESFSISNDCSIALSSKKNCSPSAKMHYTEPTGILCCK